MSSEDLTTWTEQDIATRKDLESRGIMVIAAKMDTTHMPYAITLKPPDDRDVIVTYGDTVTRALEPAESNARNQWPDLFASA